MGVRPPAGETGGEPEVVEFGIAALDATLEESEVSFPTTTEELRSAIGEREVAYDATNNRVQVAEVLDRLDRTEFDDRNELMEAAHPVFEELRAEGPVGILGWLRSLFS